MIAKKEIPTVIDSTYFVVKLLGAGVQGQVFKVQSMSNPGNFFALKLINISEKNVKIARKIESYIKSEFSLLKSLNHRNIVKVFDFGFDTILKSYYFTMEYLDGQSLYDFFHQPHNEVFFPEIQRQILNGLHFLHTNKILHYDINPKNIIIISKENGFRVKLLDFGLAEINQLKMRTKVKKSILYISPELYTHSGEITEKIDIYALGVSLLHSLSCDIKLDLNRLSDVNLNTHDQKLFNHKQLLANLPSERISRYISCLIERNPKLRLANAEEAIHCLNSIFGTSYPLPRIASHDSFQRNSRFLIRNDIVNRVINYFCNYRVSTKKQTIVISGESGSGKSRIADQLHFNFSCMFHKTLLLKTIPQKKFGVIISLIDQVYLFSSTYLKTDMLSFFNLLTMINRNISKSSYYQTLFPRIFKFLHACCEIRELTIIFDEYEKYDLYSQQFIQYLVVNANDIKMNIVILFGSTGLSKREEDALAYYQEVGKAEFLNLLPLSLLDIKYIRYFLLGKSDSFPDNFEDLLHKAGGSNFRKLMLLFDSLITNKAVKKLDGVYQLENSSRLLRVLKMNENKLSQSILKKLNPAEITILLLLAFAKQTVSPEVISKILCQPLQVIRNIIIPLDRLRLIVALKKEQYSIEYRLYSTDVAFGLLPIVSSESIILALKMLSANRLLEGSADIALDLLCHQDKSTAESLANLLDSIQEPNQLLFFCHVIEKIRNDEFNSLIDFRSILIIYKIKAYHFYNNQETIRSLLNELNKILANISSPKIKSQVISLEIGLLTNLAKFSKAAGVMLKYSSFLVTTTDPNLFFDNYLLLLKQVINSGYKQIGKKIAFDIEKLLNRTNDPKLISFNYLLSAAKILFRITAFKPTKISEIENHIIALQKDQQSKLQLFNLYSSYHSICRSYEIKLHTDWKKWLQQALLDAENLGEQSYFTKLANLLFIYYHSNSDYRNSLNTLKKQISVAREINHEDLSLYLINLGILKTDLLYPTSEIIAIKKEGLELARLNNQLSYYTHCVISICHSYVFSCDFITALQYWQEAYNFSRYCPIKDRKFHLESLIESGAFLLGIEPLKTKLQLLYSRRIISKEELVAAQDFLETQLAYYVNKSNYTDENGLTITPTTHNINLPGLLLLLINRKQKIPTRNELTMSFDNSFIHKPFFKIVKDIVKYMLSPDDYVLEKAYLTLKKVYQLGYEMDVYFRIIPLVEYLFIIKSTSLQALQVVDFLREIQKAVLDRMNETQKTFFRQVYEYKRAEKTLQRYDVLLNK